MSDLLSELEDDAGGADISIPAYLTIDPTTGKIGANFTGIIHAEGLNLDLGTIATPPDADRIRWLDSGGHAFGYLFSNSYVNVDSPTWTQELGMLDGAGNPVVQLQLTRHSHGVPVQWNYGLTVICNGVSFPLFNVDGNGNVIAQPVLAQAPPLGTQINAGFCRYFGKIPVAEFPPTTSPQDGDTVDVVMSAGVVWRFIYDSSVNATYPWQFVGGPSIVSAISSIAYGSLSAWHSTAAQWITERAGIFEATGSWAGTVSGAMTAQIGVGIGGANPTVTSGDSKPTAGYLFNISTIPERYTVGLGVTISLDYWINAVPTGFNGASLKVTPVSIA